jgi:hypothetical protein
MTYVAVTPLVIAKSGDYPAKGAPDEREDLYLYLGAEVPESVSKEEVARLKEGGFIATKATAEKVAAKPDDK